MDGKLFSEVIQEEKVVVRIEADKPTEKGCCPCRNDPETIL